MACKCPVTPGQQRCVFVFVMLSQLRDRDAIAGRDTQNTEEGDVIAITYVGGLHHHYDRRAAGCQKTNADQVSGCTVYNRSWAEIFLTILMRGLAQMVVFEQACSFEAIDRVPGLNDGVFLPMVES